MLERTLGAAGFAVALTSDGGGALVEVEQRPPGLIVLDLGLPGLDGLAVCRRLRAKGVATPILMLTARDAVRDRVAGLEAGADDYLVKPFAIDELVARLHALERRGSDPRQLIAHGELVLEPARRQATRGGRTIELTGRETALLEMLLRQPGRTVTRERAIEEIWGGAVTANVVDRYITRLRRKLGHPPLIRTIRGTGFVLVVQS